MPKVRELAINAIPSGKQANGYWMCQKSTPTLPLTPTCDKDKPKPKKNAGSLPHDAVVQLRQQLQQQIHG
jgi:hypothetical protein